MRDFVLKYGLFIGLLDVLLSVIQYLLGVEYMASWWLGLLVMAVVLGAAIWCGLLWRRSQEGYLDFRQAFVLLFLLYAVANFIVLLYNISLFTVLDPSLGKELMDSLAQKTMQMMEKWGAPQEAIDKTLQEFEKRRLAYSVSGLMQGYLWSLLWGAFFALAGGLGIRKTRPPV